MTIPTQLNGQTTQSSNQVLPFATMIKRLVAGGVLINVFVFAFAGLSIFQSWFQYHERAESVTLNLARVLEESIDGDIDKVDIALRSVQNEVARQLAGGGIDAKALNQFLAQQHKIQPEILSLRALDAEGVVRYGRGVPTTGAPNNADREYFIRARDESSPGLIVTKPVFTRLDRKWAIVLARRLNRPDGSFAGVVYANVALEHLGKTFSKINVGQHGVVALRDNNLGLVARLPELPGLADSIGSKPSPDLQERVQAGRTSGTYRTPATPDNVERTVSYRKLSDKPFYIIVGVATDDYLLVWRQETVKTAALMSLFFLATLFSAWMIYHFWKSQAVAVGKLREQKEFLDGVLESEPECVKVMAPNGALVQINKAGLAMLEVESIEEVKEVGLPHFVHPDYRDAFLALSQRVLCGESGSLECQIEGKKGTRRWLDTHATPLRNAEGKIIAFVGVSRDVTDRKRAEAQLQELNETLENRVDEAVGKVRALAKRLLQVQDDERKHLARELHDETGQLLTAAGAHAHAILTRSENREAAIHEDAKAIIECIAKTQSAVRGVIHALRPSQLSVLGLADSLRDLAGSWQKQHPDVTLELSLEDELSDLNDLLNISVYRFVQEALTNVAKHAEACHVSVRLHRETVSNELILTVVDDGKGLDPASHGEGFGLRGMQERATAVGGTLTITSKRGGGVHILARLPVNPRF